MIVLFKLQMVFFNILEVYFYICCMALLGTYHARRLGIPIIAKTVNLIITLGALFRRLDGTTEPFLP